MSLKMLFIFFFFSFKSEQPSPASSSSSSSSSFTPSQNNRQQGISKGKEIEMNVWNEWDNKNRTHGISWALFFCVSLPELATFFI